MERQMFAYSIMCTSTSKIIVAISIEKRRPEKLNLVRSDSWGVKHRC